MDNTSGGAIEVRDEAKLRRLLDLFENINNELSDLNVDTHKLKVKVLNIIGHEKMQKVRDFIHAQNNL